jgi:hypothetical protein
VEFFFGDAGEVRLDVEDGGAVQHVNASHVEVGAFAAEEFDGGQGYRVWTKWGTGGEDSVGTIVRGRCAEQVESLGAVELPDDDEMGEAFDVGEALFELGQDFEYAFGVVFSAETFGDVFGGGEGTADVADGAGGEHRFILNAVVSERPIRFPGHPQFCPDLLLRATGGAMR